MLILSAFVILVQSFAWSQKPVQEVIYRCGNGQVSFLSDAELEKIRATSSELKGAIDASGKTFLFAVDVISFKGFNSGLQAEHFNENYLETSKYPKVSFQGKIVEDVDLSKEGSYEVRAKGMLDIHGIKQERIIKGSIRVSGNTLTLDSRFTVLLEDHDIKIPRVVYQKIAPEIQVELHAVMERVTKSTP